MSDPDPQFDSTHPSGQILFRSCRGGYLHSVLLGEGAMDDDAQTLATAILRTARVSHLKSVMRIRQEIIDAGFTPSAGLPGPADLAEAEAALLTDRLGQPSE